MTTYASLFSGVGGWDLGLERAGFGRPLWMCEIAPFPRRVLAKRFSGVRVYGDITRLHGADVCGAAGPRGRGDGGVDDGDGPRASLIEGRRGQAPCPDCVTERPDILVASPPCQDLSVAGKRAGLAGARSGLFFDFTRLAGELRPSWLLMEQVPGLLSSHGGEDFGIVLDTLDQLGYGVAWRVLDAQHFGVPQRRRRVYLVGHLGGPVPSEVLFESEGGSGHPAPRGQAGAEVAGTLGGGAAGARGWRNDLDSSGAYIPTIGRALTGTMGKHHDDDTDTLIAHSLTAGTAPSGMAGRRKEDDVNLTIVTSGPKMFDGSGHHRESLSTTTTTTTTFTASEQPMLVTPSVRRLTPRECERLMGFPDDWTCLCDEPHTETTWCADGPRYAACGNAVVANVAEWIGRRLRAVTEASVAA